jgi:hypothetical protein
MAFGTIRGICVIRGSILLPICDQSQCRADGAGLLRRVSEIVLILFSSVPFSSAPFPAQLLLRRVDTPLVIGLRSCPPLHWRCRFAP